MQQVDSILVNLSNRWVKKCFEKNKCIYLHNFMEESRFFDDYESIKSNKLPYIYTESVDNDEINYIEISTGLVRAVPVFYKIEQDRLYVSDNIDILLSEKSKVTYNSLREFLVFSYVLGEKTLFGNVKQVQAGETLRCKAGSTLAKEDYFIYDSGEEFDVGRETLLQEFEEVLYKTFELYTKKLRGKKIIVPLSGGYDSRLIVTMCKEFGLTDVLCVSYGIESNFETKKASIVAQKLGYSLDIVVYKISDWISLIDTADFLRYVEYASQKSTLAHFQECLMMTYIKNKYSFSPEDVAFVPGHAADFVAGSHLPRRFLDGEVSRDILKQLIFEKHSLRNTKDYDLLDNYDFKLQESYKNFEYFDWRERQAKFIANANRNYDYNGYSWAMPYWFNDYVLFWCKVPLIYKYQKNLYDEYLEEVIFKKYGINFDKEERQKVRQRENNRFYLKMRQVMKRNNLVRKIYKKVRRDHNPIGIDAIGDTLLEIAKAKFPTGNKMLISIVEKEYGSTRVNSNAHLTDCYLSKILEECGIDEL